MTTCIRRSSSFRRARSIQRSSGCLRAGPPSSTGTRSTLAKHARLRCPRGAWGHGGTGEFGHACVSDGARSGEHDCGTGCDGQDRGWDCSKPGLSAVGARLVGRTPRGGSANTPGSVATRPPVGSGGPMRYSSRASTGAVSSPRMCGAARRTSPDGLTSRTAGPHDARARSRLRSPELATAATAGRAGDRHLRKHE